jgi:MFS superfamily sulfate permease-like transporter
MEAALSAGELACQLPPCLASLGRDCRDHTRRIRNTGVARLCGPRRLPPQVGIYGYLLGGGGYAFLGSSRQLAIGPTSAISLMMAGTLGEMAGGDMQRYAQIASLAAFTVAALSLLAWLLRLSVLVKLISDSILVGFKAGAGLTIAMTQMPSLLGVKGGGHNFFERAFLLAGQLGQMQYLVLVVGIIAIGLIVIGERMLPGRPVALGVVMLAIIAATLLGLPALGVPITGEIPAGLPTLAGPALRLRDVEGIIPLAAGCLLLAYIEGVSAARTFAAKHGYTLDPRQELLGIGAANFAAAFGHGYPVAGGLSQSAVNDRAGARTSLALVFASVTLALSDRLSRKSPQGGVGGCSADCGLWATGFSGTAPYVAGEPIGFLGSSPRARRSAVSWNTSRHPARRTGLDIVDARAGVAPAYCVSWSRARNELLF